MGGNTIELSTKSIVVGHTSRTSLSWIVVPPFPLRRIQWWFQFSQQGDGTKLVQEVEVDLGEAAEQFGGLEMFKSGRGADLSASIKKTLENVKRAAE